MEKKTKNLEILRQLVAKAGAAFDADDKFFVKALSSEIGVEFKPRYNCKDCYRDQAALLYKLLNEPAPVKSDAAFVLRSGVDVMYKGVRVCDATLTDDLARRLVASGFPKEYFAKCE